MTTPTIPGALLLANQPIVVPAGILEDGTKAKIESAVALNVPDGAHLAVLALLDENGNAVPEGKFGAAWKMNDHWKLAGEVDETWGGKPTGYVGIVGVF